MTLEKLSRALGAVVACVDATQIVGSRDVADLRAALDEHLVLFLRDQQLTPVQQRDFARRFGPLYTHPFHPSADEAPEIMVLEHNAKRKAQQDSWHADVTFLETPPSVEVLYAEVIPPTGGDTCWANMFAAYEALSPDLRRLLDGLHAEHDFAKDFPPSRFARDHRDPGSIYDRYPPVIHPAVTLNPATGKRALYVNTSFTTRIVELSPRESSALLAVLFDHISQPEFHVRWKWRTGDLAIWDNRWTQHYAYSDYFPHHRRTRRATVLGDRPQSAGAA